MDPKEAHWSRSLPYSPLEVVARESSHHHLQNNKHPQRDSGNNKSNSSKKDSDRDSNNKSKRDSNGTCHEHQHTDQGVTPAFPFLYSPTDSTSSRDFPSAASRDALRTLTREIIELTMPQSPLRIADDGVSTLDPTKYDPARSMEVPIVYNNKSSHSSTDSTHSSRRQVTWKDLPDTPDTMSGSPSNPFSHLSAASQYSGQCPRHLPQSKSDGNVKSFDNHIHEDPSFATKLYGDWATQNHHVEHDPPDARRGRNRSRSPVKILEDLNEDIPLDFAAEHRRPRSRSPHKKLFGENGWLGPSPDIKGIQPDKNRIAGLRSLGEKIKQRVEDITSDVMKSHSADQTHPRLLAGPNVPVSLDPAAQSRLYSELELMICATANKFLVDQYRQGRLSNESITKVTNFWTTKNRPQVIQFQFDQATQRDLILYNIRTLGFKGECARNPVVLNATMYDWKSVAKEMGVRTFCYPDSVVRKHMHDTHKILEMLGAELVTFLAFQELQVNALAMMKSRDEKKLVTVAENGATERWPGNRRQHHHHQHHHHRRGISLDL